MNRSVTHFCRDFGSDCRPTGRGPCLGRHTPRSADDPRSTAVARPFAMPPFGHAASEEGGLELCACRCEIRPLVGGRLECPLGLPPRLPRLLELDLAR